MRKSNASKQSSTHEQLPLSQPHSVRPGKIPVAPFPKLFMVSSIVFSKKLVQILYRASHLLLLVIEQ